MRAFTYDVESTELTKTECAAFAGVVRDLCYRAEQHQVSVILACNCRPQGDSNQEIVHRQARRMWRTEARL
jgi:hypothetical protein